MSVDVDVFGRCAATGIGSLPFTDIDRALELVLESCPAIPYLPQLPNRSFLEGMCQQVADGLPAAVVDADEQRIWVDTTAPCDEDVLRFAEAYETGDVDTFAFSQESASGFFAMLDHLEKTLTEPLPVLKGHLAGPITVGLAIHDENGAGILHNPVFGDLCVQIVKMKALWLAKQMRPLARHVVISCDEPALSALGSAYFPIDRDRASVLMDTVIEPLQDKGVAVAAHCCGNTDWSVFLERADIVSFDAYSYFEQIAMYSAELAAFYARGGVLAWGIVPTLELTDDMTAEGLAERLDSLMNTIADDGISLDAVRRQAVVTPACGLGPLDEASAVRAARLTTDIARILQTRYFPSSSANAQPS